MADYRPVTHPDVGKVFAAGDCKPIAIVAARRDDMREFATHKGRTLSRYQSAAHDGDTHWSAEDERTSPAVFCECGSDTFRISYGSYECFAECSACGRKGSIYSG